MAPGICCNIAVQFKVSRQQMRLSRWQLLMLVVAWLTASGAALPQRTEDIATVYIEEGEGGVIAFLPAMVRDSQDQGAIEARALVGLAIETTTRCLGEDYISYQVVFADRIVIRWPGDEESFEVGQFAPLTGLLFRPGSSARILIAGAGPGALVQMLSAAASEYFGKRCISG
jgi:hypothetical protein